MQLSEALRDRGEDEDPVRTFGVIAGSGDRLVSKALSRQRLEYGKALLGGLLVEEATHLVDKVLNHVPLCEEARRQTAGSAPEDEPAIPANEVRLLARKVRQARKMKVVPEPRPDTSES